MIPLRVLVADDHRLFRQGLIGLMKTRADLVRVVGEASTGHEAVRMAQSLEPDIVLLDLFMPDGDGLEATAQIRMFCPKTAVIMLTSSEADEHIYRAVQAGAAGYLLKDLDADELFHMLTNVNSDEVLMTRAIGTKLLRHIAGSSPSADTPRDALTEREIEVLRLVAAGASNPHIAESLCISINTVKVHLRNILDKLSLENRTQAAAYAVRSGIVQPTPVTTL